MNILAEKKGVTLNDLKILGQKQLRSKSPSILKEPLQQKFMPSEHLLKYKIKPKPFFTQGNLNFIDLKKEPAKSIKKQKKSPKVRICSQINALEISICQIQEEEQIEEDDVPQNIHDIRVAFKKFQQSRGTQIESNEFLTQLPKKKTSCCSIM